MAKGDAARGATAVSRASKRLAPLTSQRSPHFQAACCRWAAPTPDPREPQCQSKQHRFGRQVRAAKQNIREQDPWASCRPPKLRLRNRPTAGSCHQAVAAEKQECGDRAAERHWSIEGKAARAASARSAGTRRQGRTAFRHEQWRQRFNREFDAEIGWSPKSGTRANPSTRLGSDARRGFLMAGGIAKFSRRGRRCHFLTRDIGHASCLSWPYLGGTPTQEARGF